MTTIGHTAGSRAARTDIAAIDLFCGAGGLTCGLERVGIDVRLGVDIDPACAHPYASNNRADFLLGSVVDLKADDLREACAGARLTLLAGCAPCQPFSTYQRHSGPSDSRRNLLAHFARLATEMRPDLVAMENVPKLANQPVFMDFVAGLERQGLHVHHEVVDCTDFGVPQTRRRLILLASRLGPITLRHPDGTRGHRTVRQAIGHLEPITAGEASQHDRLHWSCTLSPLNMRRIQASKPGGTWRDWDEALRVDCHRQESGKYYSSVYGRMAWDEPAPTLTTQFFGFGNGRFGHPEQDRAISLREGALLQGFPEDWTFAPEGTPISRQSLGRIIGNAVPVHLAQTIGDALIEHAGRLRNSFDAAA